MAPASNDPARTRAPQLAGLLDRLAGRPTPAVVWYGSEGGRVELSGRVSENWIAKTANLLVDDLGMMAGDRLLLDPVPHWRTLCVAVAAWRMGAVVVLPDDDGAAPAGEPARVAVLQDRSGADSPREAPHRLAQEAAEDAEEQLVLAYPGLAMRLPEGVLRDGQIDYCAEIRAHGDRWSGLSAPAPEQPALVSAQEQLSAAQLMSAAAQGAEGLEPGAAIRLDIAAWDLRSLVGLLSIWSAEGTAILTDRAPSPALEQELSAERIADTWR